MPVLLSAHPFEQATFGLWQIAEPEDFFLDRLPLARDEERDLAPLKGIRRAEWLAGRYLLHLLTGENERLPLAKTAFAKPFFLDKPDLRCSLSHSHGIVGALLATVDCGCDVQVFVDKMPKLAPKFINSEEFAFVNTFPAKEQFELFHAFWTAKESLYKAYGLRELDFRKHMRLEHFLWPAFPAETTGWIAKDDYRQPFSLLLEKHTLPDEQHLMTAICYQPAGAVENP
ncbi:MAG: 4'-phosphopantetheinyl transferase superfamily protein [Saprospiraceae bacterium]|nr:4'-phosphopantetheinyl transferase superfamily protein [Saprospiraceae bacterium]